MTRTLAPRILWTASAAAAVGLGVLAVSAVDAGAAPPDDRSSSSAPAPAAATGSQQPAPAPDAPAPSAAVPGQHTTVAGTVVATCDTGALSLSGTPATGWWLDDSQDPGQVEFENGTQDLEVTVACAADGTPQFSVEGPRADDSGRGRGRDDSAATPVPSAPTGAPRYDDSAGRVGGGHGSDDGPGDDSRGRGRGGDDD
ncbi:hypothetical protein [Geodermatophilus sp. SYSU D00079]